MPDIVKINWPIFEKLRNNWELEKLNILENKGQKLTKKWPKNGQNLTKIWPEIVNIGRQKRQNELAKKWPKNGFFQKSLIFQSNAFNRTLSIEPFQSNAFNRMLSIKRSQSNAFYQTLSIQRFQSNAFIRTLSFERFQSNAWRLNVFWHVKMVFIFAYSKLMCVFGPNISGFF